MNKALGLAKRVGTKVDGFIPMNVATAIARSNLQGKLSILKADDSIA